MAPSTDLGLMAFYVLALAANGVVSVLQLAFWLTDGQVSLWKIWLKILLRVGLGFLFYVPMVQTLGRLLGAYLVSRSETRRRMIMARVEAEEKNKQPGAEVSNADDEDWEKVEDQGGVAKEGSKKVGDFKGIIGFFHPFCNAGGGGERVLWAAIRASQQNYPGATCVVYTGDHDATKPEILARVKTRFNIELHAPKIFFLYLSTRSWVLASKWPRFTLLGQSIGSVILAIDAFSLLVPDVFVDTMGYAFALGLARFCFPEMPTGAYVHYPTISTDMLGSLDAGAGLGKGLNAGGGKGLRGLLKREYWHLFAKAYSWVGGSIDVVMANSSWTGAHIRSLWSLNREKRGNKSEIEVVFPPVAVEELADTIEISEESEKARDRIILYIAQYRPEKNHKMILEAFAELLHSSSEEVKKQLADTKLVLIGSVRDSADETKVYELRLLVNELKVVKETQFICDASWDEILRWLQKSSVGVNGMWNEHFGIGVVEYQAAGLISVVNDSGGPKNDIVIDYDGGPTGFHASTSSEYATAFRKALLQSPQDNLAMRLRARASAKRFTEHEFAKRWLVQTDKLISMYQNPKSVLQQSSQENFTIAAMYVSLLAWDATVLFRGVAGSQ